MISEGSYFSGAKFYLNRETYLLRVTEWVLLEVMNCPSGVKCGVPDVMSIYINKNISVIGHLEMRDGYSLFVVNSAQIIS